MDEIASWIAGSSPSAALRWLQEIRREIEDLAWWPRRFPRAIESRSPDLPLRQHVVGTYRILFVVEQDTVVVLQVRHAARRPDFSDPS